MPAELTLASAFLIGLLGSTHCLGMCAGIAGALTLGARRPPASAWGLVPFLLAYNVGRLASYAAAGAVAGFLGAQLFGTVPGSHAQTLARVVSAGFMIALGIYLAGWWNALGWLERLGGGLWRRIEPFGRRLLPADRPSKALLLGLLWGWLPCGLVYGALTWSLAAGGALQGAMLMTAFGAGTLPALLFAGAAARWISGAVRAPGVRRAAGVLVILMGLYALVPGGTHQGHGPGHAAAADSPVLARVGARSSLPP